MQAFLIIFCTNIQQEPFLVTSDVKNSKKSE